MIFIQRPAWCVMPTEVLIQQLLPRESNAWLDTHGQQLDKLFV